MAQHVSDEARKHIEAMNSRAQRNFLDAALERRPSARFGAGPSTPQIGTNPSTSIDQAELIRAQPKPEWVEGYTGATALPDKVLASTKLVDTSSARPAPRPEGQHIGAASIVRHRSQY